MRNSMVRGCQQSEERILGAMCAPDSEERAAYLPRPATSASFASNLSLLGSYPWTQKQKKRQNQSWRGFAALSAARLFVGLNAGAGPLLY